MATEILNDAVFYDRHEIIGGEKFMSPAPNLEHGYIIGRLHFIFVNYFLIHKNGYVHADNTDVHFSDESLYKPDLSVVLKESAQILESGKAIYGAPDMVVEVLSYSTRNNDLGIKKDTYEAQGVREYWIVDPWAKSVSVYLLRDGKYFLNGRYILLEGADFEALTDEEQAEYLAEVPVSIVEGLSIPLKFIFDWGY